MAGQNPLHYLTFQGVQGDSVGEDERNKQPVHVLPEGRLLGVPEVRAYQLPRAVQVQQSTGRFHQGGHFEHRALLLHQPHKM